MRRIECYKWWTKWIYKQQWWRSSNSRRDKWWQGQRQFFWRIIWEQRSKEFSSIHLCSLSTSLLGDVGDHSLLFIWFIIYWQGDKLYFQIYISFYLMILTITMILDTFMFRLNMFLKTTLVCCLIITMIQLYTDTFYIMFFMVDL